MNPKQYITQDDNSNIYAAPELIRFGSNNLEDKKIKPLSLIIKGELFLSSDKQYLKAASINTISFPIDELHLLRCKDAYVTTTYGVHDSHGLPFWNSVLSRGSHENNITYPRGVPKKVSQQPQRHECEKQFDQAFYVNYLQCRNFGHLLTETASSLFPLFQWIKRNSELAKIPIIINEYFSSQEFQINAFMEFSGITRDQIIIVGRDTQHVHIQNLYLAYPTHANRRYVSRKHPKVVKTMLKSIEKQAKASTKDMHNNMDSSSKISSKVFISRSRLNLNQRHLREEHQIEQILKKNGWTIYHPQSHSIAHQKNTYETAKFICGAEGSAFHLFYGCKLKKLRRVILLSKHKINNFTLQFDAQNINYKNITCLEPDPSSSCEKNTCENVILGPSYTASKIASIIRDETNL